MTSLKSTKSLLSNEQIRQWHEDGFLIIKNFLNSAEIGQIRDVVDDEWCNTADNIHEIDVLTGPYAGQTYKMSEVPQSVRSQAYKLNNLFARRQEIRKVVLSKKFRLVCQQILDGDPIVCNSLNFERGSQQGLHIDSWYMPPPVENKMVAASLCIDDVDYDNGPITYFPKSHKIPPYIFSDGRINEITSERDQCRAYLDQEILLRQLQQEEFRGKSGDILLWHGQLLHGGRPILNYDKTRSSLVVHYWRASDLPLEVVRSDKYGGYYLGHTLRGELQY
jgi:phytanoyl-CoA hydroxylase